MEYFSLKEDDRLKEIEKEKLFKLIDFLQQDPRPRQHIRNVIAAAVITMSRFNKQLHYEHYNLQSFYIAMDLIAPTTSNYIKSKPERLWCTIYCNFASPSKKY